MNTVYGYDAWLTTPPEPVFHDTMCESCDETFSRDEELFGGDMCPACEIGELVERDNEPPDMY